MFSNGPFSYLILKQHYNCWGMQVSFMHHSWLLGQPMMPSVTVLKFPFTNSIFLADNLPPALLLMGTAAMCLHYDEKIQHFFYCPIPFPFGELGAGKTTTLCCALSLWGGGSRSHFFSRATRESLMQSVHREPFLLGLVTPPARGTQSRLSLIFSMERSVETSPGGRGIPSPLF